MKLLLLRIIFVMTFASDVQANAGFWDNPLRATGSVLINSARFTLRSEELSVQMRPSGYALQVRYHTVDRGASVSARTAMYFPVICHKLSDRERKTAQCVRQFKVTANGRELESIALAPDRIDEAPRLKALSLRLQARLHSTWANDFEDDAEYVFFRTIIPADAAINTIDVAYEADYSQEAESISTRADATYSPGRVVYDFSPAAQWAGNAVSTLSIRVDTSGLVSPLKFDARQWPFSMRGESGELTISKPDFARLPPLVLSTDNDGYMNYKNFVDTLQRQRVPYRIEVLQAKTSRVQHASDVRALFDRDPQTYWCWRGGRASLRAVLAPGILHEHQGNFQVTSLVGLGVLNGAVRDPADFARYGLARTIEIRPERDASDSDEADPPPVKELPRLRMRSSRDHFRSNSLLNIGVAPDGDPISDAEEAERYRKTTAPLSFVITIQNVHRRKGSDESCITEIYPVYPY